MFHHRRMRLICMGCALLMVLMLAIVQVVTSSVPTAHAATNQFHGVNWADPNDNFVTGDLVPVGLSTSDSYATTYAKATVILKGFQALGANTVRLPFNAATTSGSWWGSYTAAWDAASALGMKVIVAPWLQNGTVSDTTSFYNMWNTVLNKYSGNSNFYFDVMNEPWAMNATTLTNFLATWLSHYPNIPRGRVMLPALYGDNLCPLGADSRLNGTLLTIHMYTLGGETHPTEAGWVTSMENNLCGYASRAVLTEFGVPMNTGVNYDGPRDYSTNDISFLYALTDTVRSLGMGSLLWTGVKQATQTQGPGPCENASCAITSLNGSGTNLSLSVTNQSGLDRLQYGWGQTNNAGGGGSSGFTPTPGTYYEIVNHNSGQLLDITGASKANGGLADQWPSTGGTNQEWSFTASNGGYKLVNVNSGLLLDDPGWSTTAGTQLDQWSDTNGANQWWNIVSAGNGSFYLVNQKSGDYADVTGASTTNGAAVIQWSSSGGTNQQWTFIVV